MHRHFTTQYMQSLYIFQLIITVGAMQGAKYFRKIARPETCFVSVTTAWKWVDCVQEMLADGQRRKQWGLSQNLAQNYYWWLWWLVTVEYFVIWAHGSFVGDYYFSPELCRIFTPPHATDEAEGVMCSGCPSDCACVYAYRHVRLERSYSDRIEAMVKR